ncbi:MAG: immunity 53 family protein [Parachlamydiaceae bacterium]|nr:immunity 53 family protein [Parachlamydiaceae bacterium]
MINNNFEWLLQWYNKQCDGDWEHGNGIEIGTIDNPGWYLRVNIDETELQNKHFDKIVIDRSENDWIQCFIEKRRFDGVGGPFNLPEILQIFRNWAESRD